MKKINKKAKKMVTKKANNVSRTETIALEDIIRLGILDAETVIKDVLADLNIDRGLSEKIISKFTIGMYKAFKL